MEDSLTRTCPVCGQPAMEGDHPTPLCQDCRNRLARYPIPLWIRAFGAAILLLALFSLYTLPAHLSLGIGLERAQRAVKENKFRTAERELKKVTAKLPDNVEANGLLLIAAFRNNDLATFQEEVKKLAHINFDDDDLFRQVDETVKEADIYLPGDSLEPFTSRYPDLKVIPDTAWSDYFARNPDDHNARLTYADMLFDAGRYARCDSVLREIPGPDAQSFPVLMLEASVKRELGQYDSALQFNLKILDRNQESVEGLASEARTLLRQKKDAEAFKAAMTAYRMDTAASYAQASLILAYHFNNRLPEQNDLIRKAMQQAKDSSDKANVQYALDVICKKEKFRD